MISLLLLAEVTTALGSAPQRAASSWMADGDYPAEARLNKWSGPTMMDLSISDAGRVVACRTVISSGHEVLDREACAIISKAARYKPARDENGQAIAAGDFSQFVWTLPGELQAGQRLMPQPDLIVTVKRLPPDVTEVKLAVRMVQSAEGVVESCVVAEPSNYEAFDRIACRVAEPLAKEDRVNDKSGAPVRHLRMRRIMFTLGVTK